MICQQCGGTQFTNSWHQTDSGQGLCCVKCKALLEWNSALDLSSDPYEINNRSEISLPINQRGDRPWTLRGLEETRLPDIF